MVCLATSQSKTNNKTSIIGAGIKPMAQVILSKTELKVLVIDKILLLTSGKAAEIRELIGQQTICMIVEIKFISTFNKALTI